MYGTTQNDGSWQVKRLQRGHLNFDGAETSDQGELLSVDQVTVAGAQLSGEEISVVVDRFTNVTFRKRGFWRIGNQYSGVNMRNITIEDGGRVWIDPYERKG